MKKNLFFAMLGMSTIGFSQAPTPYPYTSHGLGFASPIGSGSTYSVPDSSIDDRSELILAAGLKFNKFDAATVPATAAGDKDKTFANNLAVPAITTGTDENRIYKTTTALNPSLTTADQQYYSCIRQNGGVQCSVAGAMWAYYTINFTEAVAFNPVMRWRDGMTPVTAVLPILPNQKENAFTISIYAKTDMSAPIYTQAISLDGLNNTSVAGNISADGKAEYLAVNGTTATAGQQASVWYKIIPTFTPPAVGEYVVKINQTAGTIFTNGLGAFTFIKDGNLSTSKFSVNNLKVYTNGRTLNVNFDSTDEASVSVYDMIGRQVLSKRIVSGSMVAELPAAGFYVVNVESKGAIKATKVVVE